MQATTQSDPVEAAVSALVRHGAAAVLWVARYALQRWLGGPPALGTIALDVALVLGYVLWVNKPLEAALGGKYALRPHWSALFVIPSIVAIFILGRDIWFALRGTAL